MTDKITTGSSTDATAALPKAVVKVDNTSVKIATPDLIIFGSALQDTWLKDFYLY